MTPIPTTICAAVEDRFGIGLVASDYFLDRLLFLIKPRAYTRLKT